MSSFQKILLVTTDCIRALFSKVKASKAYNQSTALLGSVYGGDSLPVSPLKETLIANVSDFPSAFLLVPLKILLVSATELLPYT